MFRHLQYASGTYPDQIGKGQFTSLARYVAQTYLQEALKDSFRY
jgi:hypothetical protein